MKRMTQIVSIVLFLAFLFGLCAAFWLLPDRTISQEENRRLQTMPKLNLERILDGRFGADMNTYFADQFPLRDFFVGLKAQTELALWKGENNGVLLGKNSQLATHRFFAYRNILESTADTDGYYSENLANGVTAVNRLAETFAEQNIPLTALFVPRTLEVAASAFSFPVSDELHQALRSQLGEAVNAPDLLPSLRTDYDAGQYVYYRTDHHWTTACAYNAYTLIMDSYGMGTACIPADRFAVTDYSDFYGTTYSKSGFKGIAPDTLSLWRLGNEDEFVTTDVSSGESFSGFYNTDFLTQKDKYSVFLDGTHSVLTVKKQSEEPRETLLLAKDSFANCLAPFLAQHFDLVILDLSGSGDETELSAYAERFSCTKVLLVYNYENIIGTSRLAKVK